MVRESGFTIREEHKGKIPLPEEPTREVPEGMIQYFDGSEPLSEEELAKRNVRYGDDDEALMRRIDPDAYKEYQRAREEGLKSGTQEGIGAGMKYLVNWVIKKAKENPQYMDRERETQRTLDDLSRRFAEADKK